MSQQQTDKRVVICGGGVIGSAIAYFLSLRGVAATIVERSSIACAASGKAGGFLALDWSDGSATGPLARRSFGLHERLAEQLQADTGYRRVNTWAVTATEQPAKGRKRPPGLPEWVDGNVTKAQLMGREDTTAQVHPAKLTQAFVDAAARNAGTAVRIGAVTGVKLSGSKDSVEGVEVDGELMAADVVVIAMGPWSSQAAAWLNVPRITGDKATSILLRPDDPLTNDMLFTEFRDSSGRASAPEVYPRPDGSVYICGEGDSRPLPDDPAAIEASPEIAEKLKRVGGSVSSRLRDAPMEVAQACFLPISPDGAPVIGAVPGVQGAYIAAGHSCWGILNAPATGEAMSEIILDGAATSVDISALSPSRFVGRRNRVWA